jgi:hypothetical protein
MANNSCQSLLLTSLTTYYQKNPTQHKVFKDIIQGKSTLSLRILDWFVTHYARTNDIIYWIDDTTNEFIEEYPEEVNQNLRKFNLYLKYRAELQSYTKMYFDPFRRHERISFLLEIEPLVAIETTVGQLNFFRWALHNHVLTYINKHLKKIEEHMALYQKNLSKTKSNKKKEVPTTSRNTVMRAPCFIRFD